MTSSQASGWVHGDQCPVLIPLAPDVRPSDFVHWDVYSGIGLRQPTSRTIFLGVALCPPSGGYNQGRVATRGTYRLPMERFDSMQSLALGAKVHIAQEIHSWTCSICVGRVARYYSSDKTSTLDVAIQSLVLP